MTDEYDDLLEETPPEPLTAGITESLPTLATAASLLSEEPEPAELGFEPEGRYRSFLIVGRPERIPLNHASYPHRFYVSSPRGVVGLVPWAGSQIIWPWERGWDQDLHRDIVTSRLKEPEKKKK